MRGVGGLACARGPASGCCGPRSSSSATGSTPTRRPTSRGGRRPTGAGRVRVLRPLGAARGRCGRGPRPGRRRAGVPRPRRRGAAPRSDDEFVDRDGLAQLRLRDRVRARARLRPLRGANASSARRGTDRAAFDGARLHASRPASSAHRWCCRRCRRWATPTPRTGCSPQTECPSWLYSVTMGATTVWERWDSLLPDGSMNPGEMTSFNHYALGAVADWIHQHDRRHRAGRAGLSADSVRAECRAAGSPGRRPRCARRTAAPRARGGSRTRSSRWRSRCRRTRRRPSCSRWPTRSRSTVGSGAHQWRYHGRRGPSMRWDTVSDSVTRARDLRQ